MLSTDTSLLDSARASRASATVEMSSSAPLSTVLLLPGRSAASTPNASYLSGSRDSRICLPVERDMSLSEEMPPIRTATRFFAMRLFLWWSIKHVDALSISGFFSGSVPSTRFSSHFRVTRLLHHSPTSLTSYSSSIPCFSLTSARTRSARLWRSDAVAPPAFIMKFAWIGETSAPPSRKPLPPTASISLPALMFGWVLEEAPGALALRLTSRLDARRTLSRCSSIALPSPGEAVNVPDVMMSDLSRLEPAVAIRETALLARKHALFAGFGDDRDVCGHLIDVSPVRARVHHYCATNAAGNSAYALEPAEIVLRRDVRDFGYASGGTSGDGVAIDRDPLERLPELDHDAANALIGNEQIRAVAKHHPRQLFAATYLITSTSSSSLGDLDEIVRRAAHAKRRMTRHRLVLQKR